MSNSLATVIASLYEFHRNGYNFASGTISAGGDFGSAGGDFGEAIKEPTFSNILSATAGLISSIGAFATFTGTSNGGVDNISKIADTVSLGITFDKFKEAVQDTFDKWREQAGDFFAKFDFPNIPTDWLPDIVKDWLDLPRTGEYHIYDPLTLDLNGGAGDDIIHLLSGNNHAYGGDGDDILYSGIGNDKLEGGIGSDVYVLGKNFGKDEIINFNPNGQDKDVIKFTDGIYELLRATSLIKILVRTIRNEPNAKRI